ncbi:MAG: FtsX-like permease family protein [bacterium]|nr:FtsX-like permease family protein [bacterium]
MTVRYKKPSAAGMRLLKAMLKDSDHNAVIGDFEEVYYDMYDTRGRVYAYLWYWVQVFKSFPKFLNNMIHRSTDMFKNYLKISLRNLTRNKSYSIINISGLATGMACCMLIMLYINDELSYDNHNEKADRIYRIVDDINTPGQGVWKAATASTRYAPVLVEEFPEVENAVRFLPRRRLAEYKDKKIFEDNVFYSDASVFNIFSFDLISGDPGTALTEPGTVVLSESIASKYFGNETPVGNIMKFDNADFRVTGVMKDMPSNSHFFTEIFLSMKTLEQIPSLQRNYFDNWAKHEFYTYLLLREGVDFREFESKLPAFIEEHAAENVKSLLGGSLVAHLQPLRNIYLRSDRSMEIGQNGDIKYVYIFSIIALFILLIACINFMNLATARAANRAKEVGLRKVAGATKKQLIRQFMGESFIFTIAAMFISLVLINISMPFYNSLTGKEFSFGNLMNMLIIAGSVVVVFLVGLVSGSYPAFFISRFQPVRVLKGDKSAGSKSSGLRKLLVVIQFSLSIILISGTGIVLDQVDFLKNRKLGFDKEHVVILPIRLRSVRNNYESVKAELLQNPNVLSASISIGFPGEIVAGDAITLVRPEGNLLTTVSMFYTDHDFVKTMGIEIVEGRDFSKEITTDESDAFITNEAFVRNYQIENPLETRFEWSDEKSGKVIGVVRDFQYKTLKNEISPLVIHIQPSDTRIFAVRIRPENIAETLDFIQEKWVELNPGFPYEYSFLDETFDKMYRAESKQGQIFTYFSVLAIFIAALGLFGLASFMIEQRTKEIGIRKSLGASVRSIIVLVSKEFTRLVFVANIISLPPAYFLMNRWLQNFAYRVELDWKIFIISGLAALFIALLTVSFQSVKAALINPAKTLRHE